MNRIYADIPKFKRIHQALVETARQNDAVIKEIEKSLTGPRSVQERELLGDLRNECVSLKQLYIETVEAFAASVERC